MRKRKEKKWLVAKKQRGHIYPLGYRHHYSTKAKAQKVASKFNKRVKRLGAQGLRFVVRRVGWQRKRWHS